jgi:hypothetical protein
MENSQSSGESDRRIPPTCDTLKRHNFVTVWRGCSNSTQPGKSTKVGPLMPPLRRLPLNAPELRKAVAA